jgi:hypothetical protein
MGARRRCCLELVAGQRDQAPTYEATEGAMGGRRVEGAGGGMVCSTIEEVARRPGDGEDYDYGW